MELIPSSDPSRYVPTVSQEPWAQEIRQKYGDIQQLSKKFGVNSEQYCYRNAPRAIESEMPPFSRLLAAYGKTAIESLIGVHVAEALAKMGEAENVDIDDVQSIAESICACEPARFLSFPSIF